LPTLKKYDKNPIIAPRENTEWEKNGTFNPAAFSDGKLIHILYRAVDSNHVSRLGYARTLDGRRIDERPSKPVLTPSARWEELGCEDPRITRLDGTFLVTYTAYSRRGPRIALASTNDLIHFEKYGLVGPDRNDKDWVIFPERINGNIAILHRLKSKVQIAFFDSIESLTGSRSFWRAYVKHFGDYEVIRAKFPWEERKVGVGPPPIKTERGWLVIYHGVSRDLTYRVGAMLLDLDDPRKVVARTKAPILEPEADFEKKGVVSNVVFPEGAVVRDGELLAYYGGADRVGCVASAPLDEFLDELHNDN
jgi:beta-1,2-mannobiose phosphorylase / 1,2-beta-oligomannan phosphorylase